MVHPYDMMYFWYSWAEAGFDFLCGANSPWFVAKDVFDETEARARGLLNEEDENG